MIYEMAQNNYISIFIKFSFKYVIPIAFNDMKKDTFSRISYQKKTIEPGKKSLELGLSNN